MNLFSKEFRNKLTEKIGLIESVSGIEPVIVAARKSADYTYLNLCSGIFSAASVFTFMIFDPEVFEDELIYFATLAGFALGFLIFYIPVFARLFVQKKTLLRNAEIYARALFQKGKIYETESRQGLLIFISLFERAVIVIEDKNITKKIPINELNLLKERLSLSVHWFSSARTAENIFKELDSLKTSAEKYIPVSKDDVNEIPDDLEIVL